MTENTTKTRRNLIHYLDDDEIENELTFNEDGKLSDEEYIPNQQNKRDKHFKRRRLFYNLSTSDLKRSNDNLQISYTNKNNKNTISSQNIVNSNEVKNNTFSSYLNGSQELDLNNSYEFDDDNDSFFMPSHKSIKVNTNIDTISSQDDSSSTSPVFISTPIAISTPNPKRHVNLPVRSSTPILPSSLLKSDDGSFSSLSSISSINRSKIDSNLSSIKEDYNSPSDISSLSLLSSLNFNESVNTNNIIPSSSPISEIKQSKSKLTQEEESNLKEINDIYSTEKLMNSKLIINLPTSVRNRNIHWNLGINSSDPPYSTFAKEIDEKKSIFSPYRSPILNNDGNTFEYSDYSPISKQDKYEPVRGEVVLFKPVSWKQTLQELSGINDDKSYKNNIPSNDLMIKINNNISNQDSFSDINNVSNSSTPTSAIITNKLPLLSLNKSPDKLNNPYNSSNSIPINQNNNSNSCMNTSVISPISPISPSPLLMNTDNNLLTLSSINRKEIDIPYFQEISHLYGGNISSSSSFSTSPSPITSSALMNVISRNNTELQNTIKNYKPNNMKIELNKTSYTDLFDYKKDFPRTENYDNNTIPTVTTTTTNLYNEINENQIFSFGTDSMDVDF
ncbi:hypothetical protein BCR36DRAFT_397951 [Piromyces finnis]|uniref:Uncharacterized protein n=1 Tax=Piromyces finnis TaxID=1754191 RepID=A0A1Y1V7Y6_9FUNG|nr:hypothetical protein BCR36DRAFT_397951 [Piromyces finnis]|eukprot:ORX49377.1 hypothetical protein BCR36DRAFT_397951 [Piromyces finnis]